MKAIRTHSVETSFQYSQWLSVKIYKSEIFNMEYQKTAQRREFFTGSE